MIDLIPLGTTVLLGACAHDVSTGGVATPSSATFDVFVGTSDTPKIAGGTITERSGFTGALRGTAALTTGNGFAVGDQVQILVTGTVGGVTARKLYECRLVPAESVTGVYKVDASHWTGTATALVGGIPSVNSTTITASPITKLVAQAAAVLQLVVGSGSTTTAVKFSTVEGTSPSSINDFYSGRVIIFTSGALAGQATSITSYTGSTTTATVPALTGSPANAVTAVIV